MRRKRRCEACKQIKLLTSLDVCKECYNVIYGIPPGLKTGSDRFGNNRERILKRDRYKCQLCGAKENLAVHHFDGKDARYYQGEPNHSVENLITLCTSCHATVHKQKKKSLATNGHPT